MNDKPILCLDFDGVIHSYTSGWKGADVIPDPPVPGAMAFIDHALEHFSVHVFSSRSHQHNGILAMKFWLELNMRSCIEDGRVDEIMKLIQWPTVKPPALVSIDDRAIQFDGTWPSMDAIRNFKPWNKRSP